MTLVPFQFEDHAVRVIERDGEPWFVAADIAKVLEIGRTDDAVRRLDDDERGTDTIRTPGGDQEMVIINESGLYSLVLTSRKDAAKRFKKWVTAEVIPSIRKTGSYGADPMRALNDPAAMRGLLLTYSEKVLALQAENAELAPKADALDRLADAHGTFCRSTAAKTLGVPPMTLIRWMRTNGWTFRRPGDKDDLAYQSKIAAGLLEHKLNTGARPDGTEWSSTQVRVTAKGMTVLAKAFPPAATAA